MTTQGYEREREIHRRREQMRTKSREEVTSILTLAGLKPERMWELANGYWPDAPTYDDVRTSWWLAQTSIGLVRLGWRKRVIEIDWNETGIKATVTEDDVTKGSTVVHAYSQAKAVEYPTRLREAAQKGDVREDDEALAKRGNVTPAEVADLHINSWEWEHLVPAMDDEAFIARMEHSIKNCGWHKRPFGNYNEAVEGLYAPELLRRFKFMGRGLDVIRETLGLQKDTHHVAVADDIAILVKALEWYALQTTMSLGAPLGERAQVTLALVRQQTETTTCEACDKKIVVLASESDDVPATFCGECGGGRTSVSLEELLP